MIAICARSISLIAARISNLSTSVSSRPFISSLHRHYTSTRPAAHPCRVLQSLREG
jgi:hypothetical protein